MSYKQQLQDHYKAVRARMLKYAIPEKKALPLPMPESQEPPKAGLVLDGAENKIVTDALAVSDSALIYDTAQALRLADELVNSPRLPPIPGLVINEIGAVRWMRILHAVAVKHQVDVEEILSNSRRRLIVEARFEVFYRLRVDLSFSYTKIAQLMRKDHTTVMHGVSKLRKKLLDQRRKLEDDVAASLVSHPDQNATHTDLSAA
jgi:hypothetical protein